MWPRREDLSPNQDGRYLIRWTLLRWADGRALYLHKFVGSDWAREPHDHPKDFVSIGLWGSYEEEIYYTGSLGHGSRQTLLLRRKTWSAPWFRKFKAEHIHRVAMPSGKPAWTLVYTGPARRAWGFYNEDGSMTPFKDFVLKFIKGETYD